MSNITNSIEPLKSSTYMTRFFASSFAMQIIFTLIFVALFIKELIYFIKKRTQDTSNDEESPSQNGLEIRQPAGKQLTTFMKFKKKSDNFFMKLTIMSILALNVVLITSYEYLVIGAFIGIILILLVSCIQCENPIIVLIFQLIPVIFIISWFINMYTVDRKDVF